LFADETVSNTILCEAHMVRGIAIITDTCRPSGGGEGYGLTPEEIKIVESVTVQTSARQGSATK
jgi:hypothetical protein